MEIIKGKLPGPKKVVIYGPEGIGKSIFASNFPNPLFIDTEGSTKEMDVSRTPTPGSWTMLLSQVQYIINHPNICRTLNIDTVDWAEILCIKSVCDKNQKDSIESFGYGKGYVYVQEEFGKFLNLLEEVINVGINVVFTAHAKMRKFEQPDELGAYDRWEMKLSKNVAPMVKEWADMVLFCNYKTVVINVDGQGAQKGKNKVQGGKRVMYTAHHPCWDAKNRYGLPEECEFNYEVIRHLIEIPQTQKTKTPASAVAATEPVKETAPDVRDFMQIPEDMDEEVDFHCPAETENKVPEVFRLPEYIPKALRDLMEANLVSEEELMEAVYSREIFPKGTLFRNLPQDYIDGVLISAWPQVLAIIKKMRESYDIPFDK